MLDSGEGGRRSAKPHSADDSSHHSNDASIIESHEGAAAGTHRQRHDVVLVRHAQQCVGRDKEVPAEDLPAWRVLDRRERTA